VIDSEKEISGSFKNNKKAQLSLTNSRDAV